MQPNTKNSRLNSPERDASSVGFSTDIQTKVKILQLKELARQVPAMMVICLALMIAVLLLTYDEKSINTIVIWAALFSGTIGFSIWAWWATPKIVVDDTSLDHALNLILFIVMVFSTLFCLLPMALQSPDTVDHWIIYGAAIVVAIGVTGFSLTSVPKAVWAFMIPIFLSSSYYAAHYQSLAGVGFVALFAVYVAFSVWKSIKSTKMLIQRTKVRVRIQEQDAVIKLLLRDFEENSSDWLWETDCNFCIINASERFSTIVDLPADQLNGYDITTFSSPISEDLSLTVSAFVESVRNKLVFQDISVPIHINGKLHWWSVTGKPSFDDQGNFVGFRGVCSDVTIQKAAEDRVQFLAHNDALTGLANRTYFTVQLNQFVGRLERYGTPFSLLYIDLDQFKAVNDTRGHPVGDKVLEEVGKRLQAQVRETDVLARIGGDEFAIIAADSSHESNEAHLAQRIIGALKKPYEIEGETVNIGASIGITKAPLNGTRPDQLQRNSDLALYRAKNEGKDRYKFFVAGMDSHARERRALEADLRDAVVNDEFELFFQPLVDVKTELATGFEALIRWNHPIRGIVPPGEFIPLAESIGLIEVIGKWVINEACKQAAKWPDNYTVAVNLSAHQFGDDSIIDIVKNALKSSKLDASRLELEITESLMIDQPDEVIDTLTKLKKIGVAIAMDDFGTGYSSLSYLLKFPFDKMKIDRAFVVALETDSAARSVLKTIVALGESLNMKITIEGVETRKQVDFLSSISCHQMQGFYFAKPIQSQNLPAYLLQQFNERQRQNSQQDKQQVA